MSMEASSSSSVLWAKPSKEWVIPPKPKPGRKPKKNTSAPEDGPATEDDRRGQNRAAQRAFRQRKEEQLAELQARVKRFEEGEVERHVALQAVSRRLKDENDALRAENERLARLLEEKSAELEMSRTLAHKRPPPASSRTPSPALPSPKRARVSDFDAASVTSWRSSPPLTDPSWDARSSSLHTSAVPSIVMHHDARPAVGISTAYSGHGPTNDKSSQPVPFSHTPRFVPSCGFCIDGTACLCAELAQAPEDTPAQSSHAATCLLCAGGQTRCICGDVAQDPIIYASTPTPVVSATPLFAPPGAVQPNASSILDELPAFQAAVPLRRRPNAGKSNMIFNVAPIFGSSQRRPDGPFQRCPDSPIQWRPDSPMERRPDNLSQRRPDGMSQRRPDGPSCTGDPSNCAACADDAFGKAFCTAVGQSLAAASSALCANCPSVTTLGPLGSGGCLGAKCAACPARAHAPGDFPAPEPQPASTLGPETIPCNEAWQQLKDHPNVCFADLHLLAEVVARRSKCTGPRVIISPPLGAASGERDVIGPYYQAPDAPAAPAAPLRESSDGPSAPASVPSRAQIVCGKPSIREVPKEAVRDAMRLLEIIHPTSAQR